MWWWLLRVVVRHTTQVRITRPPRLLMRQVRWLPRMAVQHTRGPTRTLRLRQAELELVVEFRQRPPGVHR